MWIDGALADPATASVHWSDHGLTVGDGVFETIELRGGHPFALSRHLRRLGRSMEGLGLMGADLETVHDAADDVATAWGTSPGRLRITVTGGAGPMGSGRGDAAPTVIVAAAPMTVRTDAMPIARTSTQATSPRAAACCSSTAPTRCRTR